MNKLKDLYKDQLIFFFKNKPLIDECYCCKDDFQDLASGLDSNKLELWIELENYKKLNPVKITRIVPQTYTKNVKIFFNVIKSKQTREVSINLPYALMNKMFILLKDTSFNPFTSKKHLKIKLDFLLNS